MEAFHFGKLSLQSLESIDGETGGGDFQSRSFPNGRLQIVTEQLRRVIDDSQGRFPRSTSGLDAAQTNLPWIIWLELSTADDEGFEITRQEAVDEFTKIPLIPLKLVQRSLEKNPFSKPPKALSSGILRILQRENPGKNRGFSAGHRSRNASPSWLSERDAFEPLVRLRRSLTTVGSGRRMSLGTRGSRNTRQISTCNRRVTAANSNSFLDRSGRFQMLF